DSQTGRRAIRYDLATRPARSAASRREPRLPRARRPQHARPLLRLACRAFCPRRRGRTRQQPGRVEAGTCASQGCDPARKRPALEPRRALGVSAQSWPSHRWPLFLVDNPKVQSLARKWYGLLDQFTGGDPGLFNSTRTMYANEDQIRELDV